METRFQTPMEITEGFLKQRVDSLRDDMLAAFEEFGLLYAAGRSR